MDPRNGDMGNTARVSREVQLESIVSSSTWGLSTGQNPRSPYRRRAQGTLGQGGFVSPLPCSLSV